MTPTPRPPAFLPALLLAVALGAAGVVPAAAAGRGLLSSVVARLLDETRAEVAAGAVLADALRQEFVVMPPASHPAALAALQAASLRAGRTLGYTLLVLDSPSLLELPLPGGPVALSTGLLALASTPPALEFLLARNVALVAERQPMVLLKASGLYATALRLAKRPPAKRAPEQLRELVRQYIKASSLMNHPLGDRLALTGFCTYKEAADAARGLLAAMLAQTRERAPWEAESFEQRLHALAGAEVSPAAPPAP